MLAEPHQRLFRRLAVFADGFDLAAVEAIARHSGLDDDVANALVDLVDASLVVVEFGETVRYRLLDTLRSFAADRLRAAGGLDASNAALRRCADGVAERVDSSTASTRPNQADSGVPNWLMAAPRRAPLATAAT